MAAQLTKSQVVAWLTTTSDRNEAGQRPTWADRKVVESQVSDGNRQRERTLQAGGHDAPRGQSVCPLRARSDAQQRYLAVTHVYWFQVVGPDCRGSQGMTGQFPS